MTAGSIVSHDKDELYVIYIHAQILYLVYFITLLRYQLLITLMSCNLLDTNLLTE